MNDYIVLYHGDGRGDSLEHYGVLGMKWGVRKDEQGRQGVKAARRQRNTENRSMTKEERKAVKSAYTAAAFGGNSLQLKANLNREALGDSMSEVAKKRLDEIAKVRADTEKILAETGVMEKDILGFSYGLSTRIDLLRANHLAQIHTGKTISENMQDPSVRLSYNVAREIFELRKDKKLTHADDNKTVGEVLSTLNQDQQNAVALIIMELMKRSAFGESRAVEHAEGSGRTVADAMKTLTEEQLWAVAALFAPFVDAEKESVKHSDMIARAESVDAAAVLYMRHKKTVNAIIKKATNHILKYDDAG